MNIMKAMENIEFKGTEDGMAENWLGAFISNWPEIPICCFLWNEERRS